MLPQPDIYYINEKLAVTTENYQFNIEIDGIVYWIEIPLGFVFDGATIPRIAWSIVGLTPFGAHNGATVIHDYLYYKEGEILPLALSTKELIIKRKLVDKLFIRHLKELGFNKFQLLMIAFFIRVGGLYYWRELY